MLLVASLAACVIGACAKKPQYSADYLANCDGPPLRSAEKAQAAMEKGVYVQGYDCIRSKEATERARVAHEKMMEEYRARKEETDRVAREQPPAPAAPRFVFRLLEINEASESDLAALPTLGASGAREIVTERGKERFRDWQDVVRRTTALSQAQSAAYSSVMGLQVNGRSLEGAAADERAATAYAARVLPR
jgi:DNA uptake protein ComE-like DNA-binding protein